MSDAETKGSIIAQYRTDLQVGSTVVIAGEQGSCTWMLTC